MRVTTSNRSSLKGYMTPKREKKQDLHKNKDATTKIIVRL